MCWSSGSDGTVVGVHEDANKRPVITAGMDQYTREGCFSLSPNIAPIRSANVRLCACECEYAYTLICLLFSRFSYFRLPVRLRLFVNWSVCSRIPVQNIRVSFLPVYRNALVRASVCLYANVSRLWCQPRRTLVTRTWETCAKTLCTVQIVPIDLTTTKLPGKNKFVDRQRPQ